MIAIYCIYNNINGKCYVGSTIEYKRRINDHLRTLRNGKHHNSILQRAWNKYGESSFEIFKLKDSNKKDLLADEQWCIDILKPQYNICKFAGNTLGLKWDETRRKKQMLYLSNKTKEHKANLSKSLKDNFNFIEKCKNTCKIMCENNKKSINILDLKNNILFTFSSIKEASEILNISKNNIQSRLSKRVKSSYNNKYNFEYNNGTNSN